MVLIFAHLIQVTWFKWFTISWKCNSVKISICLIGTKNMLVNSQWLVASDAPNHCPNYCSPIFNGKLRNKLQWHLTQNPKILIQENAPENVVCEMVAICPVLTGRVRYWLHVLTTWVCYEYTLVRKWLCNDSSYIMWGQDITLLLNIQ